MFIHTASANMHIVWVKYSKIWDFQKINSNCVFPPSPCYLLLIPPSADKLILGLREY